MPLLRPLRAALAAALALAAAGCDVSSTASGPDAAPGMLEELQYHRARWAQAGIRDYVYLLDVSCACSPALVRRVRVEVRGGQAHSVTYVSDGAVAQWAGFQSLDTVEELFARVERAVREDADYLAVLYETRRGLGYPASVVIDPDRETEGDELGFEVVSLLEE